MYADDIAVIRGQQGVWINANGERVRGFQERERGGRVGRQIGRRNDVSVRVAAFVASIPKELRSNAAKPIDLIFMRTVLTIQ